MVQLLINTLTEVGFTEEVVDNIEALVDGLLFFQREYQPTAQQTATHRRYRTVDDVQQRLSVFLHGADELQ